MTHVGREKEVAIAKHRPPVLCRKVRCQKPREREFRGCRSVDGPGINPELAKGRLAERDHLDLVIRMPKQGVAANLPGYVLPAVVANKHFDWQTVDHLTPRSHAIVRRI